MPTTLNIPARTEHRCSPCEFHKCVGSFHVRSGPGSWREYNCMNPDAVPSGPVSKANQEHADLIMKIRAHDRIEGRWIGKTEKQPDWCPLKREAKE